MVLEEEKRNGEYSFTLKGCSVRALKVSILESLLGNMIEENGFKILKSIFHSENGKVSFQAILSESGVSIYTEPEKGTVRINFHISDTIEHGHLVYGCVEKFKSIFDTKDHEEKTFFW